MTFNKRVFDWEKRMEDILIEISRETTSQGFHIYINTIPIITAFENLLASLRKGKRSRKVFLKEGA